MCQCKKQMSKIQVMLMLILEPIVLKRSLKILLLLSLLSLRLSAAESYVFKINNAVYKTVSEVIVKDDECLLSIGDVRNVLRIYADASGNEKMSADVIRKADRYLLKFGDKVLAFPIKDEKFKSGEYGFYVPIEEIFSAFHIPLWMGTNCAYVTSSILYSISFDFRKNIIILSVSNPGYWRWKRTGDYSITFIPRMQTFISETMSFPVSESLEVHVRHDGPMLNSVDIELGGMLRLTDVLKGNNVIIAELEKNSTERYNSLPIVITSISNDEEADIIGKKIGKLLDGRILKSDVALKVKYSNNSKDRGYGLHIILTHDSSSLRKWQGVRIFYYPYSPLPGRSVSTANYDLSRDIQKYFLKTSIHCVIDKEFLRPLEDSTIPTVLIAFYMKEVNQMSIDEITIATVKGIIDFLEGER